MHATSIMIIAILSGLVIGLGYQSRQVQNNTFSGYHCAPIVKASTMKEAKKQIEINQVMKGVKE